MGISESHAIGGVISSAVSCCVVLCCALLRLKFSRVQVSLNFLILFRISVLQCKDNCHLRYFSNASSLTNSTRCGGIASLQEIRAVGCWITNVCVLFLESYI